MRAMSAKRRKSTDRMRAVRPLLNERTMGGCELCGKPLPVQDNGMWMFEHHHRMERSQGGDDQVQNGLGVHPACHQEIHAHPASSRPLGWLLYAGQVPEDVPVLYQGDWVLLLPDGSIRETTDPSETVADDPDRFYDIRCDAQHSTY